jgi:hypothetical protein
LWLLALTAGLFDGVLLERMPEAEQAVGESAALIREYVFVSLFRACARAASTRSIST